MRNMPGPIACRPHSLPAPRQQDHFIAGINTNLQHVGRGMLVVTSPSPCPNQGPQTPPLAIFLP